MSLSHRNQTQWLVYITIKNQDVKIRQSQKRPRTLFLGSIPIIYEWSEDANNKNKDLNAKIYHLALKTILQCIYSSFSFIAFKELGHWWCYSTA